MIELLYFASLREQLEIEKERLQLGSNIKTIADIKLLLASRGTSWLDAFSEDSSVLCSINQEIAHDLSSIKSGDEVAFFPPVTGG